MIAAGIAVWGVLLIVFPPAAWLLFFVALGWVAFAGDARG